MGGQLAQMITFLFMNHIHQIRIMDTVHHYWILDPWGMNLQWLQSQFRTT